MPKRKTSINALPPLDLAYAVQRLIASGKTTQAEVVRLAGARVQRIAALEAELKVLTRGGAVVVPAAPAAEGRPRAARKATATKSTAAAPVKLKLSPKLRAFRKVQGLYAGYLRGFTGDARERIRALNAEKGAAAAVAEMCKLLKRTAPAVEAMKAKR